MAYETSVVADPPRLAPAPAPAPSTSRTATTRATAPPPPGRGDLRDELAETERRLVRALRDVSEDGCDIKSRRHDIMAEHAYERGRQGLRSHWATPAAGPPAGRGLPPVFRGTKRPTAATTTRTGRSCDVPPAGPRTSARGRRRARPPRGARAREEVRGEREGGEEGVAPRGGSRWSFAESSCPPKSRHRARAAGRRTFCGRWLKDLPERLEMQNRIEGRERRSRTSQKQRKTAADSGCLKHGGPGAETTLRNQDTPTFTLLGPWLCMMPVQRGAPSASRAARSRGTRAPEPAACRRPSRGVRRDVVPAAERAPATGAA